MQKKTTLPSGHDLVINHVSYDSAAKLRRAFARELLKVNVQFSESVIPALLTKPEGKDEAERSANRLQNILAALSGTEVNSLKDVLLVLLSSEELEPLVMACAHKWILDGRAVTQELFEAEDLWPDLIPLSIEVAREAVLPFFSRLVLPSSIPEKSKSDALK
jgi:hypothetical protein